MTENMKFGAPEGAQVMIELCGRDDRGDKASFRTEGLLVDHGGKAALLYQEIDPDDLSATQVMVRMEDEGVTVLRGGDAVTAMLFRKGQMCESEYRAAGQSLMLRTYPTEVSVKRRGMRGHVHIVYQVTMGLLGGAMTDTGVRTLDMRFRPLFTEEKKTEAGEKSRAQRGRKKTEPDAAAAEAEP